MKNVHFYDWTEEMIKALSGGDPEVEKSMRDWNNRHDIKDKDENKEKDDIDTDDCSACSQFRNIFTSCNEKNLLDLYITGGNQYDRYEQKG